MAIKLQWYDPNFIEDGFRVYRSVSPFDENSLPAVLADLPGNTREYVDNTVSVGTTYYYRVEAYNASQAELSPALQIEAVSTSYIYIGDGAGYVRKIDPEGIEVWAERPRAETIAGLWVDHIDEVTTGYITTGYVYHHETTPTGLGTQLWLLNLGDQFQDIHGNYTHIATAENSIARLYDRDGENIWSRNTGTGIVTKVCVDDDMRTPNVYCVGNGYNIMKIDYTNTVVFDVPVLNNADTVYWYAGNDRVYYTTSAGAVGALSSVDGTEIIAQVDLGYTAVNDIKVTGDIVYVAHGASHIIALYDLDLNLIRTISTPDDCYSFDVDESGGVYAVGLNGFVNRYDNAGNLVWSLDYANHVYEVRQDVTQAGVIFAWKPKYNYTHTYTMQLPDTSNIVIKPYMDVSPNYTHLYTQTSPPEVVVAPISDVSPNYTDTY